MQSLVTKSIKVLRKKLKAKQCENICNNSKHSECRNKLISSSPNSLDNIKHVFISIDDV